VIGRVAGDDVVAEGRAMVDRVLELEIVDRSLSVGAQAFSAIIPLLIVIASLGARDGGSMADSLIERFDLKGAGADAVRRSFSAPAEGTSVTVISFLFVVISALSFTRAVQRLFERTWALEKRGMRATLWGLAWIVLFAGYWALFPVLGDALDGVAAWVVSLLGTFAFWLATPYVLLARRVPWRRLVLQGGLTAFGMTVVWTGAAIYAPRAMSTAASEFGAIGVAFTLLTLLWAGGFVLVGAAALGSYPYLRSAAISPSAEGVRPPSPAPRSVTDPDPT
jgi:membrane protein